MRIWIGIRWLTETENGFMEPKGPMRFGGDEGHPQLYSHKVIGSVGEYNKLFHVTWLSLRFY